jgi:hypothetical protein
MREVWKYFVSNLARWALIKASPFAPVSINALDAIDSEFFASRIDMVKLSLSFPNNLVKSKVQQSTPFWPKEETFPRPRRFPDR